MMDRFAGESLRHPALRGCAMHRGQLGCQLPLTTLAQKRSKQRVIAEPLARIIHTLQEKPSPLNLLQPHASVRLAGHAGDQRIIH